MKGLQFSDVRKFFCDKDLFCGDVGDCCGVREDIQDQGLQVTGRQAELRTYKKWPHLYDELLHKSITSTHGTGQYQQSQIGKVPQRDRIDLCQGL